MVRPGLTDMNLVEFKYHPFMIRLNICNGSFTVLSPKIRVLKQTKDIYAEIFNVITNKNEAKAMTV